MCSASALVGIGARRVARGCFGDTTMAMLTVSSRSRVSCGGGGITDAMTPTAQRPLEHMPDHGPPPLHVEAQRGGREFLLERGDCPGEHRDRKHDVRHDAQFGLQAAREPLRPSLEEIHVTGHGAGIDEERAALFGEYGETTAAIE